jgi:hypothetical protein
VLTGPNWSNEYIELSEAGNAGAGVFACASKGKQEAIRLSPAIIPHFIVRMF